MANELAKVLKYYGILPYSSIAVQKIVCPFHDDANPSLSVDLENNTWYCFGCGKFGDAKRFVKLMEKKYHNLNDLDALILYNNVIKSEQYSDISLTRFVKTRKPNRQLYDEAYDYYHGLSKIDWRNPGESMEVLEASQYMKSRGYSPSTLNKVKAKITYNSQYGLIFPMLDNGKFRGWVCRTMRKDIEAKRKYLYNTGFSRATTLCGDYGKKDYVVIVEGYMDRLKFVQCGIEEDNVVAILGWKISDEQCNKLKAKGINKVISALDNDKSGRKGTNYLRTLFKVTRFRYLKGYKDPGEMSKETLYKCYKKTLLDFNKK